MSVEALQESETELSEPEALRLAGALGGWAWIHWALAGSGLLLNLYAFPIEYRCLVANLELLKEVDEKIKRELSPGLYHE